MTVAANTEASHMTGAPKVYLRWGLVEQWCHNQGADSDVDRAKLFGVNRMTVGRWKRGDTGVSLPVAARVSQTTGISLADLLDEGHPSPPPTPAPNPGGPGRESER